MDATRRLGQMKKQQKETIGLAKGERPPAESRDKKPGFCQRTSPFSLVISKDLLYEYDRYLDLMMVSLSYPPR
jgi:hypothetical protein